MPNDKKCDSALADGVTLCGRDVVARGKCGTHYRQIRRYELGQGAHPDEITAEHYIHQISSRVDDFTQNVLNLELENRRKENPEASQYELIREIVTEWAVRKSQNEQSTG